MHIDLIRICGEAEDTTNDEACLASTLTQGVEAECWKGPLVVKGRNEGKDELNSLT